jgi:hypothetical protein
VADTRREEQKLWLIRFQIKAVRTRLNLLAIQYWFFISLAIVIFAATTIFMLAALLTPLAFLVSGAIVAAAGLVTIAIAARAAIHRGASPMGAATLADGRAELKGRLTTVLALADGPPQSPLWPYLVEDTYSLRSRFEPARIEPRWLSRTILAPLAVALAVVALSALLRYLSRLPPRGLAVAPTDITADIGDLEVLPADSGVKPNARIYADANTLRQLESKIANAKKSGISKWLDQARRLGGNLQDQVTGNTPLPLPSIHLRASNAQPPSPPSASSRVAQAAPPGPSGQAGSPQADPAAPRVDAGGLGGANRQPPAISLPGEQADQLAQEGAAAPYHPGADQSGGGAGDPAAGVPQGGDAVGGGSSHGAGSDPEHLFGPPEAQQLGSDSFKIAIDATPSDEASSKGAPAYIPPKVSVPLNAQQFPDEPLARSALPPEDAMTVKKVFER